MIGRALERWLVQEIHGRELPRRSPRRASALSRKPARDWKYRAWIRSLPSAASGAERCEACHTGPHGLRQKASDYTCIPLTAEEHRAFDSDPRGFARDHGFDVRELVHRLNRCWFNQWKIEGNA